MASLRAVVSLALGVCLPACGGLEQADVSGGGTGSTGGDPQTTSPMTTNQDPTMAGTAAGTTGGDATVGDTTGDGADSSTTAGPELDGTTAVTGSDTGSIGTDTGTTAGMATDAGGGSSTGPCMPMGDGTWANCPQGELCGGVGSSCTAIGAVDGVCTFPCATECDCPPPPISGDAPVTCGDPAGAGGAAECYLSCENGETCPDGMECFAGSQCAYNNVVTVPDYEGCNSPGFVCEAGSSCAGQNENSACFPLNCTDDGDCPAPPAGTVNCGNAIMGGGQECYIDCAGPLDCPPGWNCTNGFICLQPNP